MYLQSCMYNKNQKLGSQESKVLQILQLALMLNNPNQYVDMKREREYYQTVSSNATIATKRRKRADGPQVSGT